MGGAGGGGGGSSTTDERMRQAATSLLVQKESDRKCSKFLCARTWQLVLENQALREAFGDTQKRHHVGWI